MVEMAIFNVQRAITPKVGKSELRFMYSARCLIVLYICVKFGEKISDGIRVMEADTNDGSADGRKDTKNFGWYKIIPSPLLVAGHKNDDNNNNDNKNNETTTTSTILLLLE